jgi:hypothetical protein
VTFPKNPLWTTLCGFLPSTCPAAFRGRSPVIDYWQNSKRFIIFTACSLMSFELGDVFLSPEHPGPNCYHPLSVREPVRARYIEDLNR